MAWYWPASGSRQRRAEIRLTGSRPPLRSLEPIWKFRTVRDAGEVCRKADAVWESPAGLPARMIGNQVKRGSHGDSASGNC